MTQPGQQVANEAGTTSTAQTEMADSVERIRATIQRVTEAVDSAKRGWQGDAFKACNDAANAWDAEAAQLNQTLNEMTNEVGHGNKIYTGLENENQGEFKTLIGQTGGTSALTNL
ncbi:MAG: WXG100 family type VII secretion target [Nocardia sp.]|nr:WXG100 family type VII secretion target [Nocardia sp.]